MASKMRAIFLFGAILIVVDGQNGNSCHSNPITEGAEPIVKTSSGSLVGKYVKVFDTQVAAFLGIPYAKPPLNERRFREPSPVEDWVGTLDAKTQPPPCMQYSSRMFEWVPTSNPSEDCLYLNVWTPANCCCNRQERLPVIVWIYGGGFHAGSTDLDLYDGSTIVSYNKVIVVSVNYRVGIFGFLNSGSNDAPGNMGLLDQNLALKWIKMNIGYFGGNPDSITVMGESAGSVSVSLHMISPMSRNLFQRVILQSGSAYHPDLVDSSETSYKKANDFAKDIGCLNKNTSIESDPEILECLKGKSSWDLAKIEDVFISKMLMYFKPTFGNEFLPTSPLESIYRGHVAPVDSLIGTNRDETTIFLNFFFPDIFRFDEEPQLNLDDARNIIVALFKTVPHPQANEIFQQYFHNVSEGNSKEIVQKIAEAFSDYLFNCPVIFLAEKARNPYIYWISDRSPKERNAKWLGVPHFAEVPYVFGVPIKKASSYIPEDGRFSADLMKKWATFAEIGHPLADKSEDKWPVFTKKFPMAYELNRRHEGKLIFPRVHACEFWRPHLAPAIP